MSNLKQIVEAMKVSEGYTGPETLTMYKKAAASIPLNDSYPRVAKSIVNIFYKTAGDTITRRAVEKTYQVAKGLTKLAGVDPETKQDTITKLAAVVTMRGDSNVNQEENDLACYHLICDLIRK